MSRSNDFTEVLVDWVEGRLRQTRFSNLWLGGGPGPSGGSNYRPVDGQLTQKQVTFDTSEAASPCYPSGSSSLLDNLNRIRYWQEPATWFGVETLASGLRLQVKKGLWYPNSSGYAEYAGGYSPTFTLPSGNNRIDTLFVTPTGDLDIIEGTPAAIPTITLPNIALGIPLWAIYITPTSTKITQSGCPEYYAGQGYVYKDLRPYFNLGGEGSSNNSLSLAFSWMGV